MSRNSAPKSATNIKSEDAIIKNNKSISEIINSRLLEPVQVRNMLAGNCTLNIGNGNNRESKSFKSHQILPVKIQDLISIAPNTRLFTGSDGFGTNAYLYIEDAEVREYLGFIDQVVLDDETVLNALKNAKEKEFEEYISTTFAGNIPKIRLLEDIIRRNEFNDAKKIKYIENTLNINIRL